MAKILQAFENISLYDIDGTRIYLVDGLDMEDGKIQPVKYGLLQSDLGRYAERGQAVAIAQFFDIVGNGLILAKHIFTGLNRPLCTDDDMDADVNKLIHSRKPKWDCEWEKGTRDKLIRVSAPKDRVFVTITSKNNRHRAQFPQVHGWIERWNWIEEDKVLKEAPINWVDRYTQKIYTRP